MQRALTISCTNSFDSDTSVVCYARWDVRVPIAYLKNPLKSKPFLLGPLGLHEMQLISKEEEERGTHITVNFKKHGSNNVRNETPYSVQASFTYDGKSFPAVQRAYADGNIVLIDEYIPHKESIKYLQNSVATFKLILMSPRNAVAVTGEWGANAEDIDKMSRDYNKIRGDERTCDITFQTTDRNYVKLHKLFLQARFPELASYISSTNYNNESLNVDENAMNAFLQYMYSGRIYIKGDSRSLKDLCEKFNFSHLKRLLSPTPQEIVISTSVQSRHARLAYTVSNPFQPGALQTHVLRNELFDWAQLCVELNFKNRRDEIFSYLKIKYEGTENLHVICQARISGNANSVKLWGHTFERNAEMTFDTWKIKLLTSGNPPEWNTIELELEWVISCGPLVSVFSSLTYSKFHINNSIIAKDLWSLRRDFENLFINVTQNPTDGDIRIEVEGEDVWAHSVIVAARSPMLFKKCRNSVLKIENHDLKTLKQCVQYMYTGDVHEINSVSEAIKTYKAAAEFGLSPLRRKCARFIARKLTLDNFFTILKLADAHEDSYLEDNVKTFVLQKSENGVVNLRDVINERIDLADKFPASVLLRSA